MSNKVTEESPNDLNAKLNFWTEDGKIDFDADKEAARQYHLQYVNQKTQYFPSLEDKMDFLITNEYYEPEVFSVFTMEQLKELHRHAHSFKHRFDTYLGPVKFYGSYALKTFDGGAILERFEDRVVANAVGLSDGDFDRAKSLVEEIITGRLQPATPTFANIGKKQRGELVSCFILSVLDDMESIGRVVVSALQLSKRGGGVGININNIREYGAPIKKIKGQSSGVIPVCKMLDDAFTYANQLGSRQGAGAVYISVHHPDVLTLLDSKRENADEKVRLKTLSVGLTVTDVAYQKAREDDYIYQFSPYDVEREYGLPFSKVDITAEYDSLVDNPKITKKKVRARDLFRIIAELQFQSGYPYIMNVDTVNEANPIDGTVDISNLCVTGDTEILTSNGYRKVKDLYDSQEDFDVVVDTRARDMDLDKLGTSVEKSTKMFKTAENANILKMTTVEGHELRATDWHKMYVVRDKNLIKIPLNEVVPGDRVLVQSDEGSFGSVEEKNLATVAEIVADGVEDVYDVTVENGNSVIFNDIATGNCSEILQVSTDSVLNEDISYEEIGRDISCNLASLNIKKAMDGGNLGKTVEAAIRMLTNVSDRTSIDAVPSVREGNDKSHSVGLGQFSLHEFFLQEGMAYGDEDSLNFTNNYFMAINYYALKTSNAIARERGETFFEFEKSKYASAQYLIDRYAQDDMINPNHNTLDIFNKYGMTLPTFEDWERLAFDIEEYGLYNAYLQAVPPTGSISYINGGTSSIHPAVALIEARKEGKIGRVYYPTPGVTNDNYHEFEDAYQIGPFKIIDVYAEAQKHVDQGMSLTLFYKETDTTRTLNRAYAYSHHKKVKTLYYCRVRSENLEGTNIEECVSCTL